MLFLNWSKTILQPIKDSSPADHDRSANESRSVTRRIIIGYPTNQRLFTKQSRISHSNNQIFFYNRYNAFINLFRILSITIYTLILTISCSHFVTDKRTLHNQNIFHPFNFLRYIFLSPFWYPYPPYPCKKSFIIIWIVCLKLLLLHPLSRATAMQMTWWSRVSL